MGCFSCLVKAGTWLQLRVRRERQGREGPVPADTAELSSKFCQLLRMCSENLRACLWDLLTAPSLSRNALELRGCLPPIGTSQKGFGEQQPEEAPTRKRVRSGRITFLGCQLLQSTDARWEGSQKIAERSNCATESRRFWRGRRKGDGARGKGFCEVWP